MNSPLGLIGLGLVGSALAERFQLAGFVVHGHDINPAARLAFAERGGTAHPAAIDVAHCCRRIVLSLPTTEIVAQVVADLQPALQPGDILLDTTTGEPDEMAAIGQSLAKRDVRYLDATIAGSSAQVRSADVLVMLGGDAEAARACDGILNAFAKKAFYLGPSGAGARMKLVVNLVLGLHRAVLAEGLAFAKAIGVDPAAALDVLEGGPAFSRVMETKGAKMLERDFTPQARLAQHLKDVKIILAEAARRGAKAPLSELHQRLLESLVVEFGDEDNSAILRAFEAKASVGV
jgi:3-hydroxyisobutyrate dehydrogenase-like beta-hydroxyacid dehydrogenase